LRKRVREHWEGFSPAARAVCRLLTEITPERLLYLSASELGEETQTSNATVVRTLQALGYEGLADLKRQVAKPFSTDIAPEVRARRRLESVGRDLDSVWESVIDEATDRLQLLARLFAAEEYAQAVAVLLEARQILTYGHGASFVVAEHLAMKLRRMGRRSRAMVSSGFRLADDLLDVEAGDAVVIFVPGRLPIDVQALLDRIRAVGASGILITDELLGQLDDQVTVTLQAPNTPTGLTAEPLTSLVLADGLAQGVAAADVERTVEASHTLTTIRQQLGY
jgi:DNA-binding MurR/RpiR family transcriptional regulator